MAQDAQYDERQRDYDDQPEQVGCTLLRIAVSDWYPRLAAFLYNKEDARARS